MAIVGEYLTIVYSSLNRHLNDHRMLLLFCGFEKLICCNFYVSHSLMLYVCGHLYEQILALANNMQNSNETL